MKYVLAVLVSLLFISGATAEPAPNSVRWACRDTGKNSMQCNIENDGDAVKGICLDIVKICKDGDHVANLCSSRLKPGEVESKVVTEFRPKVKTFSGCMGTEYRNKNFI